ncbi:MAG: coagulation factor 5/8 type domain-containing protein, partial [Gemmatimonadota bacterium]|nr:coagulation factor 5/8 type domain-containing protein [Gemmatimonadota bacterium]
TKISSVVASGTLPNSQATFAIDSDSLTGWQASALAVGRTNGHAPTLTLDLGGIRTYGGIVIDWGAGQQASTVVVDSSNSGTNWVEAGRLIGVRGGRSYLPLTDGSSRFLRVTLMNGAPAGGVYAIRNISVRPLEFAATPTALLQSIARENSRGQFPRSMHDEQIYWSVIGVSGGRSEALLSEDGQLELAKRGPSLEPFLTVGNTLVSWNDAVITQSLLDGVRPIPSVTWTTPNVSMTVTALAAGTASNSSTYARYRVVNHSKAALRGTFWLALRPMQVNPPWQFLNTPGGAARVDSLSWNGTVLRVNDSLRVRPLTAGVRVGVTTLDAGEAASWISSNSVPERRRAVDARSLASAVLAWPVNIAMGDSTEIAVASPLDGTGDVKSIASGSVVAVSMAIARRIDDVAHTWARDQDAVILHLPATAPAISAAVKANLAWILINRDGAGIQPGSRSYERSWIRDGSLTAEALLRLGRTDEARQFAEWYARFQFQSGKVPCCVDARGADPVDENDSHGEFIHLVREVWRYTGDRAFAERMWPHVKLAADYMDSLRRTHLTRAYATDSMRMFRGLLPASISHEGYAAKPMHSYWDDGFALLGFRDAAALAADLGHNVEKLAFTKSATVFSEDLLASLERSMKSHHISYLPGSAELGDFDATSTTTLLAPVGALQLLPRAAVESTFARYYRAAHHRSDRDSTWENYTPYEWRTVGALLRLGHQAEALKMLDQFMGDRRPLNWQQWAEVVWKNPRAPKFIGDMPHTWVGSDFIRSALDLFAYEVNDCASSGSGTTVSVGTSVDNSCLIIGAGLPRSWFPMGDSVMVRGLRTPWGPLGYIMKIDARTVTLRLDTGFTLPPNGVVIHTPFTTPIRKAVVDGVVVATDGRLNATFTLSTLAHEIVLTYP